MAVEKALDILISDELREILKPIETQSLVANLLLRGRLTDDVLAEDPVNYISIGKQDKTKISYLSQDRIAALKEGDSPWTTTRRYMAKPGAFVSKLFTDIPSKEVENFSSLFLSITTKKSMRFEVVKGKDIKRYYLYESYASNNGSLGASCMKHEHCQKYLSLYTDNSDMISMVVMLDEEDMLMGRALLWNFDGNKIMDRIYTKNDEKLSFHFKQWATDNGYLYKSEQNWFNTLFFENIKTEKKELRFDVKVTNWLQSRYPYMDTFKFFNGSNGTFSNYLPDEVRNITVLTSSDGGQHPGDHLVFDDISRVYRYRNDAAFINYRNIWTSRQNAQYSNHNDMWILNEDAIYNDELGDYIFNEANNSHNKPRVLQLIEEIRKERGEYKKKIEAAKGKKAKWQVGGGYGFLDDWSLIDRVYGNDMATGTDTIREDRDEIVDTSEDEAMLENERRRYEEEAYAEAVQSEIDMDQIIPGVYLRYPRIPEHYHIATQMRGRMNRDSRPHPVDEAARETDRVVDVNQRIVLREPLRARTRRNTRPDTDEVATD